MVFRVFALLVPEHIVESVWQCEFYLWQIFHVRKEMDSHQNDIDDMQDAQNDVKVGLCACV